MSSTSRRGVRQRKRAAPPNAPRASGAHAAPKAMPAIEAGAAPAAGSSTASTTARDTRSAAPRATGRTARSFRRKARPPLWLVLAGVGLVLIIGFTAYRNIVRGGGGQAIPILPSSHVPAEAKASYNSNPPTSGNHAAQTASWGISTTPLPDLSLVHNLEHSGIVVHYRPNLDTAQQQQLTELVRDLRGRDRKVVLAPRAENDAPITVTAWGRILKQDTLDAAALRVFFDANINRGPEREP